MDKIDKPVALTPEAQALLKQLVQERDAAIGRLDMAIMAMKAALGVPLDCRINSIEEGFVGPEFIMDEVRVN